MGIESCMTRDAHRKPDSCIWKPRYVLEIKVFRNEPWCLVPASRSADSGAEGGSWAGEVYRGPVRLGPSQAR
jgi:hypothetical protein